MLQLQGHSVYVGYKGREDLRKDQDDIDQLNSSAETIGDLSHWNIELGYTWHLN